MGRRKVLRKEFAVFSTTSKQKEQLNKRGIKKCIGHLTGAIDDIGKEYIQDIADALLNDAQKRLTGEKRLTNTSDSKFKGAFDTGRLHASADWIWINDHEIEAGFEAPYADDLEFGLAGFEVDSTVEELQAWAKRKGLKNPKRAGFFVHRALKKYGLKPRPFLRMALAWVRANQRHIAMNTKRRIGLKDD